MNDTVRTDDMPSEKEFRLLQRRVSEHIGRFDEHTKHEELMWEKMTEAQAETTQQINLLATSTENLQKSTESVVKAYQDGVSFVRVGKWVTAGVASVVVAYAWVNDHIKF